MGYSISCTAHSSKDLETMILMSVYYYYSLEGIREEGFTLDGIDDEEVTIDIRGKKANIFFNEATYMDLPNVYDDSEDMEMFELCQGIAEGIDGNGFEFSFSFCDDWAGYNHNGRCKFDGKKIEYHDTFSLTESAKAEQRDYSANYANGAFSNLNRYAYDIANDKEIELS